MTKQTLDTALRNGRDHLKSLGIESYAIDAQLLLSYVTGLDRVRLLTGGSELLGSDAYDRYLSVINERGRGKPLAYITNRREFMSLDFYVDETVLIPRPDTEILVEEAIKFINKKKYKTALEIGTGSGCIAVSLAHYVPDLKVIATDISGAALKTAKKNAENNNCKRIAFIKSDLFESLNLGIKADIIISNPPYIETGEMASLPQDVRDYEPHLALNGGVYGMDFYKAILSNASNYLSHNGMVFFEIGYNQAEMIKKLFYEYNYNDVKIIKDLSGLDRVAYGLGSTSP